MKVARIAARKGQRFVVDTPGAASRRRSQGRCELVKPSLGELEHLVGRELKDPREQNREAMALVRRGAARTAAVTLGADGALLATEDGVLRVPAMHEAMHSSVGAGDAFLAAATLALACGGTPANALDWGTAAGAAAIACAGTARLRRADVEGATGRRVHTVGSTSPADRRRIVPCRVPLGDCVSGAVIKRSVVVAVTPGVASASANNSRSCSSGCRGNVVLHRSSSPTVEFDCPPRSDQTVGNTK